MTTRLALADDLSALAQIDVDGEWRHFWKGCREGKLLIQSCPSCGAVQFYPRKICIVCGADPDYIEVSGKGTLYTYSVVRQHMLEPFRSMTPYVTAMIDLPEGVRMLGNIINADLDDLRIGMSVEVVFRPIREGLTAPYWQPVST